MTGMLLVNAFAAGVVFLLSLYQATSNALEFYPATLGVIIQAGVAAVVGLVGASLEWRRRMCLAISSLALASLGVPWLCAGMVWPGGDDGGGLGWLFLVGGGCLLGLVVGTVTLFVGLGLQSKDEPKQAPSERSEKSS